MNKMTEKERAMCNKRMSFAVLGKNSTDAVYFLKDAASVNGETQVFEYAMGGKKIPYIKLNCFRRHALKTLQTEFPNIYEKEIELIYNEMFNK
jgi:hypothetical protein